jgi:lipopolysaccharide transport system ATP-binding protein
MKTSKDIVIEANHIGKKFSLGENVPYHMLRDSLVESSKRLLFRTKHTEAEKSFWALKDVSFKIKQGEVLGLIGKNGSGKSTLLKILARIVTPTTGRATIKGKVASMLEVGTGFHPELTGRENIFLSGAILGMKRYDIQSKFDEIVQFAEVQKFLDMPIKRYSSGMQVRLAFSVAANLDADVLLIDEVLAVGDASFQRKSLKKMQTITKAEGRTVVFVSHSTPAIGNLCSKALLLDQGKVKAFGDAEKIVSDYISDFDKEEMKSLAYLKGRGGSGKIRIKNFYILDKNGSRVNTMETGKSYSWVFEYSSPSGKPQKDVDFSFAVRTMYDQNLFLHYTSYTDQLVKKSKAKGKFIFDIPHLPLAAGTYKLSFRGTVEGEEADHVDAALLVSVVEGDFYNTGNIISQQHSPTYVEGKWRFE